MMRSIAVLSALLLAPGVAAAAAVDVMYAGSLVTLMERGIGPDFNGATGQTMRGFGAGSNGLANQIKGKLRRGDVFISASPKVNDTLMGDDNGNWVSWYVTFAKSPLVLGYKAGNRFGEELKTKPWYEVLREPGIRIGRTDPKLDPKGALTLQVLDRAEQAYSQPGLAQAVLGAPDNPEQVRPEESLVGRLQSGQIDIGFFYSTETADLHIPAAALPPDVTLSANYTVTILRDPPDPDGAAQFVDYLLSPRGQALMRDHGLDVVAPTVSGDASAVPASIHVK